MDDQNPGLGPRSTDTRSQGPGPWFRVPLVCLFASCQPVLLVLSVYLQHLVLISMGCCSKNQCGLGAQTKTRTAHSSGGCKGDSVAGISARAIFLVLQKTAFLRCLYLEEREKGVGEAHLQPVASPCLLEYSPSLRFSVG